MTRYHMTTIMTRYYFTALCTVFLFSAINGMAHTVWIEPMEDKLAVRFAEPGDEFETSPGHLDSLSAPTGFIVVTNSPAAIEAPKGSDHFLLNGAAVTNIACVETVFTIRGGRKPHFYARWQPASGVEARPLLTLDLVPTGTPGEVRAWFRGKPLGGVTATLHSPDGKVKELVADPEGIVRFKADEPGQYLLTIAHHRESLAGFHAGRPYNQASHNTAVTWRQQ
jgi:hypothetical protein